MKKVISLLLSIGIVLSLGGCDLLDRFTRSEQRIDYNSKNESQTNNNKPEEKKITDKTLRCTGSLEEDGFTMDEEFNIYFKNDQATTVDFGFVYDFGLDADQLAELLDSFDFAGEINKTFEEKGISSSVFSTNVESMDGNKVKVNVSGNYLDLVKAFTETGDVDSRYHNTAYSNVNELILAEANDNNLTCETIES